MGIPAPSREAQLRPGNRCFLRAGSFQQHQGMVVAGSWILEIEADPEREPRPLASLALPRHPGLRLIGREGEAGLPVGQSPCQGTLPAALTGALMPRVDGISAVCPHRAKSSAFCGHFKIPVQATQSMTGLSHLELYLQSQEDAFPIPPTAARPRPAFSAPLAKATSQAGAANELLSLPF